MAEPIEASSLYSGAPLFSFGFGVQFDVGDILRLGYAFDFPEMSSLTEFSSFVVKAHSSLL